MKKRNPSFIVIFRVPIIRAVSMNEIKIAHRLFLARISNYVGTCRVKQKQKQTKVFTNHVGGFVDSYSGSCSK